ncbi:MAG: NADH-quinone oxidoreductase subunit NuoK [Candidatus Electrothrix sp. GW3-4]|uniref:NADH-quinone oxidoreductase subunit NuoK n=1 Tax=Candidatus Electrothrix sp. GW3-4 TaxID=3126740 RepID=UPI0030CEB5C2
MTLSHCITLSLILCGIGLFGMLTRRNLLGIMLSVEIILNGANINFAAFAHFKATDPVAGAIFPIFVMAVSACEIAVALAIILSMYRRKKRLDVYRLEELNG